MSFKKIGFFLITFLCTQLLFGQEAAQKSFQLLDQENKEPIVGASYQYGTQQGLSDHEGVVFFILNKNQSITFSHVNYGTWRLTAQEINTSIEKGIYLQKVKPQNLYPVTVIALREQEQHDTQLAMVDQDRMEHDAAHLLNQLPAFNSIQKGGNYGLDPVFRGFKYDRLNIVMNGSQCASAACPNRMDPPSSQMAPNMTERIEILKGPYALRYGTGFGATINFVQIKPTFTKESDLYGRISAGYESNGEIGRTEGMLGYRAEKYNVNFFTSYGTGSDYQTGNGDDVAADFSRASFGTNLDFKLSKNQVLQISTIYNRARDTEFPALGMDLREDDTWLFNAQHQWEINKEHLQTWNTTVYASFVDHLMDNHLKDLDPRMMNAETDAKTHNYGGRTEGLWQFQDAKLYAGADLRIEGAEGIRKRTFLMGPNMGKTIEDNAWQDATILKAGLFAEYQWHTALFDYVLSGRLNFNEGKVNDADALFEEVYTIENIQQINPSVSLGILKEVHRTLNVGLWLGRAQRSAGLTERYINFFPVGQDPYEMLGNPNLAQEINNQIDLTFNWQPNERTALQLDIYGAYLQDYITSAIDTTLSPRIPSSPGVRQFINIEEAFKAGFEFQWTQELGLGLQHQLAMAYTYGEDLVRAEALPEIAPLDFRYTLSGTYLKERLKPELSFRYVAEQDRISEEFGENITPSFHTFDLRLAYKMHPKCVVYLAVNNLLDETYYEHLNRSVVGTTMPIYAVGRSFLAKVSYTF